MLRSLTSLALALAFYTAPAAAGDWRDCVSDGRDTSIKGCTAFLAREGEPAPNRARAYTNRGAAYQAKGELDRAIADYTHAIELDSKLAIAYSGRADAYKDRGELDRAIADYNRALALDPNYADAYNGRGVTFEAKGDMDKAIAFYNRALELDPQFVLAYNGRGNAYKAKGELNRASDDYNHAIELDPNYLYAYSNRAAVAEARGDLARACADRMRAAELTPKDMRSLRQLHIAKVDDAGLKSAPTDSMQKQQARTPAPVVQETAPAPAPAIQPVERVADAKDNAPVVSSDSVGNRVKSEAQPQKQIRQVAAGHSYSRRLRRRLSQRINARRGSRLAHRHHRYRQAGASQRSFRADRDAMEANFFPM